ncbi:hypothetical protein [Vibrio sp. WXL103]|uniref:hypothetical protein n=1 Tax=unclassified Vibrio TaxID=2614977 RepID=UPI003EC64C01
MIDMEQFSKSMELNHNGMQLLLVDYVNHFKRPSTYINQLYKREDYLELMTYSKKLKMTLALFSDADTPIKLARLEHLARHEFYPPEELIRDIQLDLAVVEHQIRSLCSTLPSD